MMTINNVTSNTIISTSITAQPVSPDTESTKLQNQITSKQQNLNKLTSDEEMSVEEKNKKRQEIQRQIAELNRKLRLQQMEQKEEAQKEAKEAEKKQQIQETLSESADSKKESKQTASTPENTLQKNTEKKELPVVNIEGIVAANTVITINQTQNQADTKKNQSENILESEIKLDTLYGTDPQNKKEELSNSRRNDAIQIDVLKPQEDSSHTQNKQFSGKIIIKE